MTDPVRRRPDDHALQPATRGHVEETFRTVLSEPAPDETTVERVDLGTFGELAVRHVHVPELILCLTTEHRAGSHTSPRRDRVSGGDGAHTGLARLGPAHAELEWYLLDLTARMCGFPRDGDQFSGSTLGPAKFRQTIRQDCRSRYTFGCLVPIPVVRIYQEDARDLARRRGLPIAPDDEGADTPETPRAE